jgi:hypothetical protein
MEGTEKVVQLYGLQKAIKRKATFTWSFFLFLLFCGGNSLWLIWANFGAEGWLIIPVQGF